MKKVTVNLEHCYGIKSLQAEFDFTTGRAYAIYAPNGVMKSSLARTFEDIAEEEETIDRVFPARETARVVTDEDGEPLDPASVLVLPPYDEAFGHTEKTSTLLVNQDLRREYEALHASTDRAKGRFLTAMRKQAGFRKDIEAEISSTFTKSPDRLFDALVRVRGEVSDQEGAPLADVPYKTIFDDKVLAFLRTSDFRTAIEDYIRRYNELLEASRFFRPGVFTFYNAETIAGTLASNGFFDAEHRIVFHAEQDLEVSNLADLQAAIEAEKEGMAADPSLRKKFDQIESLLTKNASMREFQEYVAAHEDILPLLENVEQLREDVWKAYFKVHEDLFNGVIEAYQEAKERREQIHEIAAQERTQWHAVIDIFNGRFFVPFKLIAKNRVSVTLGAEPILQLGFIFEDGDEQSEIDRPALMEVLSTGEKKALYILNVLFEVEVRRSLRQPTLFVVDDIADSFDYKNKYAIIQYLKDMVDEDIFCEILLTHNFDFFRTVESRFVKYSHCLLAERHDDSIALTQAVGIRNIFAKDWKDRFFTHERKRLACIPFVRNIVEYTQSENNDRYRLLTSLLHLQPGSEDVTHGELDAVFEEVFVETEGQWGEPDGSVVEDIFRIARECLDEPMGSNLENKIVLAIGIRLAAERFMIQEINDAEFVSGITHHQTTALLKRFRKDQGAARPDALEVLDRVALMTPENIHLNSFMYEPLLDMSDMHLRALFQAVEEL